MKQSLLFTGLVFGTLSFTIQVSAQVDIEKEKVFVIGKVQDVAKIIDKNGLNAAIAAVNDPKGNFYWKSDYVYLMDLKVKVLAHPAQPGLIGRDLIGLRCPVNDVPFFVEMSEHVNKEENATGWIEYYWTKTDGKGGFVLDEAGNRKPFKKQVYYMRKGNIVIFAGFYTE